MRFFRRGKKKEPLGNEHADSHNDTAEAEGAVQGSQANRDNYGVIVFNNSGTIVSNTPERKGLENLLASLAFTTMFARRDALQDAAPDTYEWVLDPEKYKPWDDFTKWLSGSPEEQGCVYWISGKAGSGKSTLVRFIVYHPRTIELLEQWSNGGKVYTPAFYFWKPATDPLQRDILGLLRSMLYQISSSVADSDVILQESDGPGMSSRFGSWTEGKCRTAIVHFIQSASDARFAIFLDGLDEYTGDLWRLFDFIETLEKLPNVKVCVASRVDGNFRQRFSRYPGLKLEILNRRDIETCVSTQLSRHPNIGIDPLEICDKAEGVFLWACVVTRALIDDFESGIGSETLQIRLHQAPQELEKLYHDIFARIDPIHKRWLCQYLRIATLKDETDSARRRVFGSVAHITGALNARSCFNYAKFIEQCKGTEKQVAGLSKGLLVLLEQRFKNHGKSDTHQWALRQQQSEPQLRAPSRAEDVISLRELVKNDTTHTSIEDHSMQHVQWVHRSASEFMEVLHNNAALAEYFADDTAIRTKVLESLVELVVAAPGYLSKLYVAALLDYVCLRETSHDTSHLDFWDRFKSIIFTLPDAQASHSQDEGTEQAHFVSFWRFLCECGREFRCFLPLRYYEARKALVIDDSIRKDLDVQLLDTLDPHIAGGYESFSVYSTWLSANASQVCGLLSSVLFRGPPENCIHTRPRVSARIQIPDVEGPSTVVWSGIVSGDTARDKDAARRLACLMGTWEWRLDEVQGTPIEGIGLHLNNFAGHFDIRLGPPSDHVPRLQALVRPRIFEEPQEIQMACCPVQRCSPERLSSTFDLDFPLIHTLETSLQIHLLRHFEYSSFKYGLGTEGSYFRGSASCLERVKKALIHSAWQDMTLDAWGQIYVRACYICDLDSLWAVEEDFECDHDTHPEQMIRDRDTAADLYEITRHPNLILTDGNSSDAQSSTEGQFYDAEEVLVNSTSRTGE